MSRLQFWFFVFVFAAPAATVVSVTPLPAAEQGLTVENLVAEALHREIYGLQADRVELLEQAAAVAPNCAPAKWHQGFVRFQDRWVHVDDVPALTETDRVLKMYDRQRDEQPDTLAGHLKLANWCREHHLASQQRAHLCRVLDFNPDHREARQRLGFRLIGSDWITADEVAAAIARRDATRTAFAAWRTKAIDWRRKLKQRNEVDRRTAASQVQAVDSPEAIPALEAILSPNSDFAAKQVVAAVARMQGEEAVFSLLRHAITSPFPEVRDEAALQLGQRRQESFVPPLLAALHTQVVSQAAIVPVNGRLEYRHAFAREAQEQREVLLLDTQYRRRALLGGDVNETRARALQTAFATAFSLEQAAQRQNRFTTWLNERITRTLNLATRQQLPAVPHVWWQWWNDQNDVVLLGQKQTRTLQRTRQVAIVDQAPRQFSGGGGVQQASSPRQRGGECFAAGTPVWTATGLMTIESIRVGDLVLSQDVESGELGYKPVLRTTVRPPEQLVRLRVGTETFETTRGHLFWVSGRGWTQACQTQSGMPLHAIEGAIPAISVGVGDVAETYNLVVDDFNTYVVGDGKLLSHDVTNRRPTRAIVPGLQDAATR